MTKTAFAGLVGLVGLQRLLELRRSRRNEARIRARGGREHGRHQMKWMTLLHGGWVVGMIVEVFVARRPLRWPLATGALAAFAVGQGLRLAAMRELGPRWTVRVMTLPESRAVRSGIFRWIRHPNYLGVTLEIAALPLVHTAWGTALVASGLNAAVLRRRIRVEEAALRGDTDYATSLGGTPRMMPRRGRVRTPAP